MKIDFAGVPGPVVLDLARARVPPATVGKRKGRPDLPASFVGTKVAVLQAFECRVVQQRLALLFDEFFILPAQPEVAPLAELRVDFRQQRQAGGGRTCPIDCVGRLQRRAVHGRQRGHCSVDRLVSQHIGRRCEKDVPEQAAGRAIRAAGRRVAAEQRVHGTERQYIRAFGGEPLCKPPYGGQIPMATGRPRGIAVGGAKAVDLCHDAPQTGATRGHPRRHRLRVRRRNRQMEWVAIGRMQAVAARGGRGQHAVSGGTNDGLRALCRRGIPLSHQQAVADGRRGQ